MTPPAKASKKAQARLTDAQVRRMQADCQRTATRKLRDGREVRYTTLIAWGSDTRYKKCRLCGLVQTHGVSAQAVKPPQPARTPFAQAALFVEEAREEAREEGTATHATTTPLPRQPRRRRRAE